MFWYVFFYQNLIILHHGDNNFLFWHLYQIHTFNNNLNEEGMITSHLMCANFFMIKMQGSSSSEIVGGPRSWKDVGHHGRWTNKILGFEKPRTAQMALKFLGFFLEYSQIYSWFFLFIKIIYGNLFLFTSVFFIKIQKIKKVSVQNEAM